MKTYGRKKTGSLETDSEEVIIDLNEICRLCMNKEDELISLYKSEDAVPLVLKIMACVALEVFEGDGLPDKICRPCKYNLEKSYNFRKKCESSDLRLRLHLRDLPEECEFKEDSNSNTQTDENESSVMEQEQETTNAKPNTEEDLVGVTKVAYIQGDNEPDPDPENITLPRDTEEVEKNACTINREDVMKTEDLYTDDAGEIFQLEEVDQPEVEDGNIDAIADAVKATLAKQTGIHLGGEVQMKLNRSDGISTQVEVTTEDGSIIIMELLTEEDAESVRPVTERQDDELPIFQCSNCPKAFPRRIELKRHASVHMQQRGFSCGICEKWFPTRSALIRHERIHTGERPFQCEVCQKSFAQKEILFRHLMTHTGQKPYTCLHCNKGFTQKEPLRVHMKSHTGADNPMDIELHYCSLCPKVFCHASGLSRHLLLHTGKTFKCSRCSKTFSDKSSLRRHLLQTGHQ